MGRFFGEIHLKCSNREDGASSVGDDLILNDSGAMIVEARISTRFSAAKTVYR